MVHYSIGKLKIIQVVEIGSSGDRISNERGPKFSLKVSVNILVKVPFIEKGPEITRNVG